jgi:macrophage erythroblast attacher
MGQRDVFNIFNITITDIFQVSREVEKDLSNHCTAKCIAWCSDNKSKLKKINSNIEFQLRVQVRFFISNLNVFLIQFWLFFQEFVELIRQEARVDAVRHAQKYFPSFEQEQLKEISQYMALLAYPINTGT